MSETLPVPVQGTELTEVGAGYYTFRWLGTRNVFLVTSDGVIATDPISVEAARLCREAIASVTDQPVRWVVYSHEHWDHIRGGAIFRQEGARFLAHERFLPHLDDRPHPEIERPDETFSGASHTVRLGNRALRLDYLGPNHGDCLLIMTPEHVDVPYICDLATAGGMPLPMIPDYALHHWVRSLDELEGWAFEHYIGGHGLSPAPKRYLLERRDYVRDLVAATGAALEQRRPFAEIPGLVAGELRPRFGHLRNFEAYVGDNVRRTLTYYEMGW